MIYVYLMLLFYATYRTFIDNINIYRTIKWLVAEKNKFKSGKCYQCDYKYYIIIPVLREQKIISQTLKNFATINGNYRLIFVTTQKEDADKIKIRQNLIKIKRKVIFCNSLNRFQELTIGIFTYKESKKVFNKLIGVNGLKKRWQIILNEFDNKKHTREVLSDQIKKNNYKNVEVLDYPGKKGLMAHQLNYACRYIMENNNPKKTFALIYNADSQISKNIIKLIEKFFFLHPEARVIQQSSMFLTNQNEMPNTFTGHILKSVAFLQSRWTLTHELPRIISQSTTYYGEITEGAHVVGHGLCIRIDSLDKAGFFPTSYINEDVPLGYILRLNGEKIFPFPVLENSESPNTINSMFTQYRTWFYGVMYYPLYMSRALRNKKYSKIKIFLWGFKYIIRALIWLLSSFVWLFLFIYPLFLNKYNILVMVIIIFIFYGPISFFLLKTLVNKYSTIIYDKEYKKIEINLLTYVSSFAAYITHSFGPILAVFDYINKIVFNSQIIKNKTER